MAVGVSFIGFRANANIIIKKGLFDKLKKNSRIYESIASKNIKRAFYSFKKPPILTGHTFKTTEATTIWERDRLVTRFSTKNDILAGDSRYGGYAIFPLFGLSTSRKYGQRNWLVKGALLTLEELTKGSQLTLR